MKIIKVLLMSVSALLFFSCGKKPYYYTPMILSLDGTISEGKSTCFAELSDSAAIVYSYRNFFDSRRRLYESTEHYGDTLNPHAVGFKLFRSDDFTKDIKYDYFTHRNRIIEDLKRDIIGDSKGKCYRGIRRYEAAVKNTIRIKKLKPTEIDEHSAVGAYIDFYGFETSRFSKITFKCHPVDKNGNTVSCDRTGNSVIDFDVPVIQHGMKIPELWYSNKIDSIVLDQVTVEFKERTGFPSYSNKVEIDSLHLYLIRL